MRANSRIAFAIDLGTAFIYSALSEAPSHASVLAHGDGEHGYWSYVSFYEEQVLSGIPAKGMSSKNYQAVVYDFKRLIGHSSTEPAFLEAIKQLPYALEATVDEQLIVRLAPTFKKNSYTLHELLGVLFGVMKQSAEKALQGPVTTVVLTVPCNYNTQQLIAMCNVAKSIGLEVTRLVSESTASLLFWKITNPQLNGNVMLMKLGAGSLEIVIASIEAETATVLGAVNDGSAGADDYDLVLVNYCIERFNAQNGIDLTGNIRACKRLKNQCEKLKNSLTIESCAYVEIDSISQGLDLCIKISREEFEKSAEPLMKQTLETIFRSMQKSGLSRQQINHIVLAGGACRMPCIQSQLKAAFPHIVPIIPISPEESAVKGAAMYGYSLLHPQSSELLLIDVTCNCIWIGLNGDAPILMINEGQFLPTIASHSINVMQNTTLNVIMIEGDKTALQKACRIGRFNFMIQQTCCVQLKLTVDLNKICKLEARQKDSMKLLHDLNLETLIKTESAASNQSEVLRPTSSLDDID